MSLIIQAYGRPDDLLIQYNTLIAATTVWYSGGNCNTEGFKSEQIFVSKRGKYSLHDLSHDVALAVHLLNFESIFRYHMGTILFNTSNESLHTTLRRIIDAKTYHIQSQKLESSLVVTSPHTPWKFPASQLQ
jgi:hypothetical protein